MDEIEVRLRILELSFRLDWTAKQQVDYAIELEKYALGPKSQELRNAERSVNKKA